MPEKMTTMIRRETEKQAQRSTFFTAHPIILGVGIFFIVGLLGIIGYGFYGLRQSVIANGEMARTIMEQRDEISLQRIQIQSFSDEIRSLEERLIELNAFEQKIRILVNLEPGEDEKSPDGVGGNAPEDSDPVLDLHRKHGKLLNELKGRVDDLSSAAEIQEDRFDTLMGKLEDQRNILDSTPSIRPTSGWLSSTFGYRTSPFTGRKELHKGIDIANRKGTDILAPANGVVRFTGRKGSMGRMIVLDHGHGMITRYAHLDKTVKKKGDTVKRGDVIAKMGNSGRSTGPHLHYEVHLNGVPVNPANYILN